MSRLYEVMFIIRPDAVDEDVDKLIAGFSTTVTNGGGAVKSVEKMGRRKLAIDAVEGVGDGMCDLVVLEILLQVVNVIADLDDVGVLRLGNSPNQ